MRNFGNPNDESWWSTWTGWVTDPFWGHADGGADAGVVGGTITTPEGTASAADVYDYQQGNSPGTTSPYKPVPDDEPAKPKVPVIAYALIAGVLGLGAYTLYKRQQEA